MSDKKVATRIPNESSHKALFKCDPPIEDWDGEKHKYVVSSIADNPMTTETYLFPANEKGEITNFIELPGSQKRVVDVRKPFHNLGYTVERDM